MWREKLLELEPNSVFSSPATLEQIEETEKALDTDLPRELKTLLMETNGVSNDYGLGIIWRVEMIKKVNLAMRNQAEYGEYNMPFDSLMFFADAGNGDQFAFVVLQGEIRQSNIFAWNHEDDSRFWVAPSLEKYIEWWLQGKIKL